MVRMNAIAGNTVDTRPMMRPPLKARVKIMKLARPELTPPLADMSSVRQKISPTRMTNEGVVLASVSVLRNSVAIPINALMAM